MAGANETSIARGDVMIVKSTLLLPDLIWIESSVRPEDARNAVDLCRLTHDVDQVSDVIASLSKAGFSMNSFALLSPGEALFVDAPFDHLEDSISQLADAGYRPAGMLLSHEHIVAWDRMLNRFQARYDVPILLHPIDAASPRAVRSRLKFVDPTKCPILGRFGVEAIHFPGHSPGSVVFYRSRDGLLLTGESAVGATAAQGERGHLRMVRLPMPETRDAEVRANWLNFDRSIQHASAMYGCPLVNQEHIEELLFPLKRASPTAFDELLG